VAKKGEADIKGQSKGQSESKEAKESKEPKKVAEASSGFNPNTFLQGIKEELDKVVWPSRQQLISESLAVILMVTLSATLIYLVDNLFGWAARQVF
jgi:preprotein translocase subunit SecE